MTISHLTRLLLLVVCRKLQKIAINLDCSNARNRDIEIEPPKVPLWVVRLYYHNTCTCSRCSRERERELYCTPSLELSFNMHTIKSFLSICIILIVLCIKYYNSTWHCRALHVHWAYTMSCFFYCCHQKSTFFGGLLGVLKTSW